MQASISSGCRNDIALHGGWDTHSSALGLQTQQTLLNVLLDLKTQSDPITAMVGDFNTPLSPRDRTSRKDNQPRYPTTDV
jgi:hypothetical protein